MLCPLKKGQLLPLRFLCLLFQEFCFLTSVIQAEAKDDDEDEEETPVPRLKMVGQRRAPRHFEVDDKDPAPRLQAELLREELQEMETLFLIKRFLMLIGMLI